MGEVGGGPVQEPPTPTTSIGRGCGGGGGCGKRWVCGAYRARAREGFGSTTRGRARPMAKVDLNRWVTQMISGNLTDGGE